MEAAGDYTGGSDSPFATRLARVTGERRLVRKGGFEPPRYCYRQPLKLVRLPVPPLPQYEVRVSTGVLSVPSLASRPPAAWRVSSPREPAWSRAPVSASTAHFAASQARSTAAAAPRR